MKDITIRFFPLTFASILFFYCKVFRPFEQNDQQTVFHIWGDGFLVAVDNNDVVIGTIAYVEKDDIVWRGVPVSGKTIVLSTVLGEFSLSKI